MGMKLEEIPIKTPVAPGLQRLYMGPQTHEQCSWGGTPHASWTLEFCHRFRW